jgi:cytochrome c peroxidase
VPAYAPPLANTDTTETILKNLPSNAADYFKKTYPHMMSQPLPAKIFNQGGIPAVIPKLEIDNDPNGQTGSYQPGGQTVTSQNAFFQSLGTNGRSCATCHQPASGMSISLRNIIKRLNKTKGTDPLFAPVDGANCPTLVPAADTSGSVVGGFKGKSKKDFKAARSLLLTKGLIRIPIPLPPDAEFTVDVFSDPTTCNYDERTNQVVVNGVKTRMVSMFRRPLISGNLHFKTAVAAFPPGAPPPELSGNIMWDGREPSLQSQAVSATMGHAQGEVAPTQKQIDEIVAFETGMFNAQYKFKTAGLLTAQGAEGGPENVADHKDDPAAFPAPGATTFDEFDLWATNPGTGTPKPTRQSIARGQALFNGVAKDAQGNPRGTFTISGVSGFNDLIGVPALPGGTCATCHNSSHSGADVLPNSQRDIGVGGQAASVGGPAPKTDLPIFEVKGCSPGSFVWDASATITSVKTNDLGLALRTGKCKDVGASTVPSLRALSAHEPFFRDGSAATLKDVVNFYNARFNIGLTDVEKEDLTNFLGAL